MHHGIILWFLELYSMNSVSVKPWDHSFLTLVTANTTKVVTHKTKVSSVYIHFKDTLLHQAEREIFLYHIRFTRQNNLCKLNSVLWRPGTLFKAIPKEPDRKEASTPSCLAFLKLHIFAVLVILQTSSWDRRHFHYRFLELKSNFSKSCFGAVKKDLLASKFKMIYEHYILTSSLFWQFSKNHSVSPWRISGTPTLGALAHSLRTSGLKALTGCILTFLLLHLLVYWFFLMLHVKTIVANVLMTFLSYEPT